MDIMERVNSYFFDKIATSLLVIEVIEIRELNHFDNFYNVVLLTAQKGNIKIRDSLTYHTYDQVSDWIKEELNPTTAVIINLNSDKIIHKISSTSDDPESYIKEIVSGSDITQFYVQKYPISDDNSIVSIIRKGSVEATLESFSIIADNIIGISIGPFYVQEIHTLFEEYCSAEGMFKFENYAFGFKNGIINSFQISAYSKGSERNEIQLGSEKLHECLVVAYAYGISFILNKNRCPSLKVGHLINNYQELVYRKYSRYILIRSVCLLFVLLLISSLVFSIYSNKAAYVQARLTQNQDLLNQFNNDIAKKNEQETLFANNDLLKASSVSLFLDEISYFLPGDVYLRKLVVHPLSSNRDENESEFDYEKIVVYGNSYSSASINEWISRIKHHEWVKNVIIKEYKQPSENQLGTFVIDITKKP